MWDYWHVPDQYTLLRTPADQFFPEEAYQQLEDALLEYGEEHLGCRGMSPVWLSYYVDGCRQVTLSMLSLALICLSLPLLCHDPIKLHSMAGHQQNQTLGTLP